MVAKTILAQMGGIGKLQAMVGAHNFLDHGDGVSFRFKGGRGVNYIRVTLDPSDTYTVEFWRIRGLDCAQLSTLSDVYADQLRRLFTTSTGLDLSL